MEAIEEKLRGISGHQSLVGSTFTSSISHRYKFVWEVVEHSGITQWLEKTSIS